MQTNENEVYSKEYKLCTECDEYHLIDSLTETVDGSVCQDCLINYILCGECNEYIHENNVFWINVKPLCQDCLDEHYSMCSHCTEYFHNDELTETYDGDICQDCLNEDFIECVYCHEYILYDNIRHDTDNDPCCEECFNERFIICEECDSVIDVDEECVQNGCILCEDCYNSSSHGEVLSYHETNIDWRFHGDPKNNRFYGVEVEIETRNSTRDAVGKIREYFDPDEASLMEDGSIHEEGFEIITHPASLQIVKSFAKSFSNISDECKGYHAKGCGMHIHFSRKSITTLTLAKFMLFFANNTEFIEFIAQRAAPSEEETQYWKHEKQGETTKKIKHPQDSNRYTAINLQNEHTIEIRIFQSNLRSERIIKNIEFVESLIKFCENTSLQDLHKKNYTKFVEQNHKTYKELYTYVFNYRETIQ